MHHDGPVEEVTYEHSMPLLNQLEFFIQHLNARSPELADGQSAIEVLEVLEMATASLLGKVETHD